MVPSASREPGIEEIVAMINTQMVEAALRLAREVEHMLRDADPDKHLWDSHNSIRTLVDDLQDDLDRIPSINASILADD
jgi:hypothetical protein